MLKKPQTRNLARNFKHIIIVLNFHHFNIIICTKYSCAPSFRANNQNLNHYICEKVPKTFKKCQTSNLARNFNHMTTCFGFLQFQHNNIYQIVWCEMLHAKQTMFELLYARECQKCFNNLKNAT